MELYRLKMGRPRKTDKAKKPSQEEGAGRPVDEGVAVPAVESNVIPTDGNDDRQSDADIGGEAGGSG